VRRWETSSPPRVLERFSDMVREAVASCEGEIVKQIGDEFMLVFRDAVPAVRCALQVEDAVMAEPRFPAVRIGAHAGPVLYREGDYVGTNVNIAARVAAAAQRHQILVTRSVRDATHEAVEDLVEFEAMGRERLKGIADEIELYVIRRYATREFLAIDPVCGMQLDDDTTEATLHWEGDELAFCSTGCLRRFLDDPDRFVGSRR
jgi:adenylate cyclase